MILSLLGFKLIRDFHNLQWLTLTNSSLSRSWQQKSFLTNNNKD